MKSFALHLVVVFIVGAQYHQIGTFCSSETTPPQQPAHGRLNSNVNNTSSSRSSTRSALLQHQQHQHQTTKTPRTIQRLVAGHIQHPRERKVQIESTTIASNQLSRTYFRRRPPPTKSIYRSRHNSTILKKVEPDIDELEDWNSDAALLEDPTDDNNWDNGILRSSAGAGKETNVKSKKKDDSKKTLADQVREGKYGLIEKELFPSEPKRPGIISYLGNKEVPGDTAQNFGGLNEDDIWLAEDHLLVIKGGDLNEDDKNEPWEPLDDYEAPNRQIKIPANPKVPPPFPVQFEDNGPIQFIGNNKFPIVNPFSNQSIPLLPGNGYFPPETFGDNEKNLLTGAGSYKNATNNKGGYFYPAPNPPWLINNETFINPFLNYVPPPINGPNGSFDNSTDYIDEDDPSLYYPPPYSFVYKSNYSSPVPPGPLVPGIILPPPPDAFARLEEPTTSRSTTNKEIPFRQVLTKITEYKPKTIVITSTTTTTTTTTESPITSHVVTPPPKEIYYTITRPPKPIRTRLYTTPKYIATNTPQPPTPQLQQDVINIIPKIAPPPQPPQQSPPPSQYINFVSKVSSLSPSSAPSQSQILNYVPKVTFTQSQNSPDVINFIPKVSSPPPQSPEFINFVPKAPTETEEFSKGNPIYYEYFDARRIPPDQRYYKEYTASASPPPPPPSSSRSHKKVPITTATPVHQSRLNKNYPPQRSSYKYDEYLYITPKPEIRPNGISNSYLPIIVKPSYKPLPNFEREVNAIRQTLQLYKDQQLQQNYIPRAPKAKAVYEYSFDSTRTNHDFIPPTQYDDEPFKPMVKYSRPVDDVNGFKAIAYAKSDPGSAQPQTNYYPTSTSPTVPQQRTRVGGKSYSQSVPYNTTPRPVEYSTINDQRNYIQRPVQDGQQYTTPRTVVTTQPWISIEKQVVQEVESQSTRPPSSQRLRGSTGYSRNVEPSRPQFNGYYYNPSSVINTRQNDRYYQLSNEEPPSKHHNSDIKMDVKQYQQQQQQQIPISLENDTYVNYAPNRPPINPDAEFIRPPYPGQYQQLPKSQPQRVSPNRGHLQAIPLNRDILVNYRLPLPPINPDSEFVQPQGTNRNAPIYHRPTQYRISGDQSGTYYYTPREVRYRKN